MFKLIPTIFLGLALILGFLVNPVSAKEGDWKCVAEDLENFTFDGGDTAMIHLSSYSSGGDYDVKFNPSKTVAKGETGDSTPFTCTLEGTPTITSVKNKAEVIPFNDLMSLMENKQITYTGSSHADRPMKVTKKNGKWQMEQTEAMEESGIHSAGINRIKMEDYPSNWIINGTWTFSKSGTKCQINHTEEKELEMYWKC